MDTFLQTIREEGILTTSPVSPSLNPLRIIAAMNGVDPDMYGTALEILRGKAKELNLKRTMHLTLQARDAEFKGSRVWYDPDHAEYAAVNARQLTLLIERNLTGEADTERCIHVCYHTPSNLVISVEVVTMDALFADKDVQEAWEVSSAKTLKTKMLKLLTKHSSFLRDRQLYPDIEKNFGPYFKKKYGVRLDKMPKQK